MFITIKSTYKLYLAICFVIIYFYEQTTAQIVIGTPNLGFTQACASESFNTYNVTFVFSPESGLQTSNQFILELSDADGDFTNATVVFTSSAGSLTTSPASVDFSLPTTTGGENYKIRVKSTAPVSTSASSAAFAAYYKLQDSPFTINNFVSTGAFCSGGSYVLAIDNPGTEPNDSPLNYPSLTYNWFKETSSTTAEFIVNAPTLNVTAEGTYFVETNYGTCTSNSFSNRVTIVEVSSGNEAVSVTSSLGNPFCPEESPTVLTTISGNTYQWFKDGDVITDATNQTYETNEAGIYTVQVDLGDCFANGEIILESELFEATLNIPEINNLEEDETLTVAVTTSAIIPTYQWYLNNVLISQATEDTYQVSESGNYKVVITETGNSTCSGSKELVFQVTEAFPNVANIPNIISPNGDGINDTWVLPREFVSGTETMVMIMDRYGKVVLQTNDYLNNWPANNVNINSINQVFYYVIQTNTNSTRKGSITLIK